MNSKHSTSPTFGSPWQPQSPSMSQPRESSASASSGSNSNSTSNSRTLGSDGSAGNATDVDHDHEEEEREHPTALFGGRRGSIAPPAFSSPFGVPGAGRRASMAPVFGLPFGRGGAQLDESEEHDQPTLLTSALAPPASDTRARRGSVAPGSFSASSARTSTSSTTDSKRRSVRIDLPPRANPLLRVQAPERLPTSPSHLDAGMDSPFTETTPFTFASGPREPSLMPSAPPSRDGSKVTGAVPGRRQSVAAGAMGSLFGGFGGFASARTAAHTEGTFVSPFEKAPALKMVALKGEVTPPIPRSNPRKGFTSNRLAGEVHKPWLEKRDGREAAARWLYIAFSLLGIVAGGVLAFLNYKKVPRLGNVCLVLEENFDKLDTSVWLQEVETGGFGNGEFEWTTTSANNSFVEDGILYIVPTLSEDALGRDAIFNGVNMTVDGCTAAKAPNTTSCIMYSNSTEGKVINPVQSARLSTRISHSVKYGRVEVRARLPTGDWLWPAIWMLPVNSTYGEWPASGEIDIMESRGNGWKYGAMGADWITSTLHWGPLTGFDRSYKTTGTWQDRHSVYSDKWHTYVVEWNEEFLWIYLDTRTVRIFNLKFNKPFWDRGDFPPKYTNGSHEEALANPWKGKGNTAPFDQDFYLILNVAVGGTNGWFPDNVGDKPWFDDSATAMKDFIDAKDQWWPTWPTDVKRRGLAVDWVKMYQKC